ncbi:hypothetical protein M5689_006583 [Euphorbia peplus]|nr:hypothetical protein M5689_006583 [Euphorbia peplus]
MTAADRGGFELVLVRKLFSPPINFFSILWTASIDFELSNFTLQIRRFSFRGDMAMLKKGRSSGSVNIRWPAAETVAEISLRAAKGDLR